VTAQEAKKVLMLYLPGTADAENAEFAEALELAAHDVELNRWFEEYCKTQMILRRRFEEIAVPSGLKEQIVSEHRAWQAQRRLRRVTVLAGAGACCALVLAGVWFFRPPQDEKTLPAFGRRMAKVVRTGTYLMDVETNDVATIRSYLAANQAHADYKVPKPLEGVENTGCGVLRWQNQKVSMICFRSGRPLDPGEKSDLFLFVIDRRAVTDAPRSSQPRFTRQNQMTTATWVEGEKLYFLAATGDEAFLRQYF